MKYPAILLLATALLGGTVDAQHFEHKEHHLGPTGLFGVTSPADIKITRVEAGSPADGKIKVGDVIVAAGGTPFKEITRRQLADAIDQAETGQAKGVLTLTLKDGRKVDLQLKVLGSYSDTAPFHCPKTDAIITGAADYLVKSRKFGRGDMNIGLLGLLATGEQKYVDVVKGVIHNSPWASPDYKLETGKAWAVAYTNLLLCEYYLLTGDKYVLPAIETHAVFAAKGRDAGGLWGHPMATNGRLPGYAQMNCTSVPMLTSLILAEKCGVRHPELQACIKQTHAFYDSFVGRGALPYGVHDPMTKSYDDNGKGASLAVAFAVKGNTRGAAFFSRMAMAAHPGLERGHTGHFFNQLWTGLGAGFAGPEASAAFFKETRWLHTLNRTWDGNFTYDGCGYKDGTFSYRGLSDAGSHLLNYCLGRHKLHITGRDADPSIWLEGPEVADTIALDSMDFAGMSDQQLLDLFDHPMPKVRVSAVWTLRPREHRLMGAIRKMLREGGELERQSAIGYFGYGCPKELTLAVRDDLVAIMRDPQETLSFRAAAAGSLCWLAEDAHPYFDDMLKLVVADKPDDPLGRIDEQLGRSLNTLCPDPYAAGLVKDKELFYAAVRKLLDHKRANGRTTGAKLIANIPLGEFHQVADNVLYIIDDKDRTYHSYHNLGPKTEMISVLANLNIKGGIEFAFDTLEAEGGKAGFKIRMLMDVLPKYGANARYALPKIKTVQAGKFQKQWDAMIKQIESATETSKMITLDEAKQAGLKGK